MPINPKSYAWDQVGGLFWECGRKSARPSVDEVAIFLTGATSEMRCAVIGASTKDLIEAALARCGAVTVLDFSDKMCRDLQSALGPCSVDIQHFDILTPVPPKLAGSFDLVLSDRLLNRFTRQEATDAVANMAALLSFGGEIRTSIKLGFYPMDLRLIEEGRRRQCLDQFFDLQSRTVDFAAAGDLLGVCLLPHGEIPRDILLKWYKGRGKEMRFVQEDFREISGSAICQGFPLHLLGESYLPDAAETILYRLGMRV